MVFGGVLDGVGTDVSCWPAQTKSVYMYITYCALYAFSGAASQDFVTAAGTILLTYTVLVRGLKPSWGNPGEFETLCVVRMYTSRHSCWDYGHCLYMYLSDNLPYLKTKDIVVYMHLVSGVRCPINCGLCRAHVSCCAPLVQLQSLLAWLPTYYQRRMFVHLRKLASCRHLQTTRNTHIMNIILKSSLLSFVTDVILLLIFSSTRQRFWSAWRYLLAVCSARAGDSTSSTDTTTAKWS